MFPNDEVFIIFDKREKNKDKVIIFIKLVTNLKDFYYSKIITLLSPHVLMPFSLLMK